MRNQWIEATDWDWTLQFGDPSANVFDDRSRYRIGWVVRLTLNMDKPMKIKINLDSLSEQELRDLHLEISRRLQMHAFVRTKSKLMAFRIGDRVAFESDHGTVEGMVTRVNQKTVTIQSADGIAWRVSPGFLTKVVGSSGATDRPSNLVAMPDRTSDHK
jgi:hypothetical protein